MLSACLNPAVPKARENSPSMHWFSTTPKTKESKGHWIPDKHKRKQYRPMWVNQNNDKLIMLLTHHAEKAKDKGSFEKNYFSKTRTS
jgi:hypothetical protein